MQPYQLAIAKSTIPRFNWANLLGMTARDWCYTQFNEGLDTETTLKLLLGAIVKCYSCPDEMQNNATMKELRRKARISVSAAHSEWSKFR